MELSMGTIVVVAITLIVVVILGFFMKEIVVKGNETVSLRCLVPFICPETAYAEGGKYIIYFDAQRGLGTNVKIKWMFLDIGEDDLDCVLTYKEEGGANKNMDCKNARYVNGYYEMEYDFTNVRKYTITLYAFDNGEEKEKREVVLDMSSGFDQESVASFVALNKRMVEGLIKYASTNDIPDYKLHKDLMVVGFNNAHTWERCGATDRITQPDECRGKACLCLCERTKLCTTERMCFGYDEIEGFVSEFGGLMYGDELKIGGLTKYYLVMLGDCGNFWPFSKEAWFQSQKAMHATKFYRYEPGHEGDPNYELLYIEITYYEVS